MFSEFVNEKVRLQLSVQKVIAVSRDKEYWGT